VLAIGAENVIDFDKELGLIKTPFPAVNVSVSVDVEGDSEAYPVTTKLLKELIDELIVSDLLTLLVVIAIPDPFIIVSASVSILAVRLS
jgi:hypothetical protein